MDPLPGATEHLKALIEAGNNLLSPHSSTDMTLCLLDIIESLLATLEQNNSISLHKVLLPTKKALVSADLLRNPNSDIRVSVVACITEIMRICALEPPYNDDQMKEICQVTVEAFGKLANATSRSYRKAEAVLKAIQSSKLETVRVTVIDESEEVSKDLLEILLNSLKKENQSVSPMAKMIVENVLHSCAHKLQPYIMDALKSAGTRLDMYSPVVSSIRKEEELMEAAVSSM